MKCTYCSGEMMRVDGQYGPFWGCSNYPKCDARVGAHKGTGKPLGTPARAELRAWRRAAHLVFDRLWRKTDDNPAPPMTDRGTAYAWLERDAGVAHIAEADRRECAIVISQVESYLAQLEGRR